MRVLASGVVAAAAFLPGTAAAVELRRVDVSRYPTIALAVVTPEPSEAAPVVEENGRPVSGLTATTLAHAKSVVLLVDRSRSMRGRPLADAVAAARSFISEKEPSDRVALVAFGTDAVQLTRFTSAGGLLDEALSGLAVDAEKGTALYDAFLLTARILEAERGSSARIILLLTDGADAGSEAGFAEARAAARDVGAVVYAIGLEGQGFAPAPLEELAADTGGAFHPAPSSGALSQIYAGIADELRRTWRIEYVTSARPGEELELDVSVPGLGTAQGEARMPGGPTAPPGERSGPAVVYGRPWAKGILLGTVGLLALLAAQRLAAYRRAGHVRRGSRAGPPSETAQAPACDGAWAVGPSSAGRSVCSGSSALCARCSAAWTPPTFPSAQSSSPTRWPGRASSPASSPQRAEHPPCSSSQRWSRAPSSHTRSSRVEPAGGEGRSTTSFRICS